jgi:hypothetical protein
METTGLNRYSVITMTDFAEIPNGDIITDNFGYRFTKDELGDLMKSTPLHPYVRTPWKNVLFSGINIPIGLYFDQYLPQITAIERHSPLLETQVNHITTSEPYEVDHFDGIILLNQWRSWANENNENY